MYQVNIEPTIVIDYHILETYIKDFFGIELDIPDDQECSNDSALIFVIKKELIGQDKYEEHRLNKWKKGDYEGFMLRTILQDMVNREVLPEGKYVIEISW